MGNAVLYPDRVIDTGQPHAGGVSVADHWQKHESARIRIGREVH